MGIMPRTRRRRKKSNQETTATTPALEQNGESAPSEQSTTRTAEDRRQPSGEVPTVERRLESENSTIGAAEPTTANEAKSGKRRRRRGRGGRRAEPQSETAPEVETEANAPAGTLEMLINIAQGDECRIAIVRQGRLEDLSLERQSTASHVGNIYKGLVTNVEPSIQAAFIDFGIGRNGFLHISDLQPQYFPDGYREVEDVGRKISRRDRPPIQRCLGRGDEVIVQVTKEGIGTKGPTLTTYLSLPGRYLVMMPGMSKLGVSRRIEDMEDRQDMREVLQALSLPPDMGFILRTAGLGQNKRELQRDLNYLQRLWKLIATRIKKEKAPVLIYQESDLVTRTIRDLVTSEFSRIWIDDETAAEKARDFLRIIMPRHSDIITHYHEREPLFNKYNLEKEIELLNSKRVPLPSGGSLIIESTEALVAIDVNSGRFREQDNAELTAYRTNMEASEEIARQLRLRDLGGLIICDYIDMISDKHKRSLEKTFADALKAHKERVQMLRISQFGIIELTRQRRRPSIKQNLYEECPSCSGSGMVKTTETLMLNVLRLIQTAIYQKEVAILVVRVPSRVAHYLLNRKRAVLTQLESELQKQIIVEGETSLTGDQYTLEGQDGQGRPVRIPQSAAGGSAPHQHR
ncbi:MAG: Ribonuclease E [Phycisphaerae bacterium]|nr:Ribonuclease E [Phycisphaerae bacterium]